MNFIKPTKAMLYEDKKALEASIEVIKKSGAKTLYLGHGKPISIESI